MFYRLKSPIWTAVATPLPLQTPKSLIFRQQLDSEYLFSLYQGTPTNFEFHFFGNIFRERALSSKKELF